ncbi:hypothetical protein GJ496_006233 [Pomphorhynchus laevis]|nr:hypothetical protein GJ496_006233 [Pomphorhynchus laevis]
MTRRASKLTMKNKRSWRKIDTSDLDKSLENKRIEERTGGLRATKPNEELFVIDRTPNQTSLINAAPTDLDFKMQHLRCFSALENTCSVPARVSTTVKTPITNKQKSKTDNSVLTPAVKTKPTAIQNLWDAETQKDKKKKNKRVNPRRYLPIIPAIPAPHDGISYLPDSEKHKEILYEEFKNELIYQDEVFKDSLVAKKIDNVLKLRKGTFIPEILQGFEPVGSITAADEEQESMVDISGHQPRNNKPKTSKQKNKRRLAKLANATKPVNFKETIKQFGRMSEILKEISSMEKVSQQKCRVRKTKKLLKKYQTKRIGHGRYVSPVRDFQVSSELGSSLRALQTEGDLLRDRFCSFQKRNILVPKSNIVKRSKQKILPRRMTARNKFKRIALTSLKLTASIARPLFRLVQWSPRQSQRIESKMRLLPVELSYSKNAVPLYQQKSSASITAAILRQSDQSEDKTKLYEITDGIKTLVHYRLQPYREKLNALFIDQTDLSSSYIKIVNYINEISLLAGFRQLSTEELYHCLNIFDSKYGLLIRSEIGNLSVWVSTSKDGRLIIAQNGHVHAYTGCRMSLINLGLAGLYSYYSHSIPMSLWTFMFANGLTATGSRLSFSRRRTKFLISVIDQIHSNMVGSQKQALDFILRKMENQMLCSTLELYRLLRQSKSINLNDLTLNSSSLVYGNLTLMSYCLRMIEDAGLAKQEEGKYHAMPIETSSLLFQNEDKNRQQNNSSDHHDD